MCSQAVCVCTCWHAVCMCMCAAIGVQHVIACRVFVIHALVCGPCALRVRVGVQSAYLWGCNLCLRGAVSPSGPCRQGSPPPVAGSRPRGAGGPWSSPPAGRAGGGGCPTLCPHAGGGKLSSRGHPHCRRGSGHSRGGGSVRDAHRGEPEPLQLRALRGNQTPRVSGTLTSGPRATCRFDEPCFLLERGDEGGPRFLSGWQSHRDCQDQAGLAGAAGIAEQR